MDQNSPHNSESFRVIRCHTFLSRLKGFQGQCELSPSEVLWLKPCSAVHTFGMHWPLTLIFLDRQANPVRVVQTAWPRRFFVCQAANSVIEMLARSEAETSKAWSLIARHL